MGRDGLGLGHGPLARGLVHPVDGAQDLVELGADVANHLVGGGLGVLLEEGAGVHGAHGVAQAEGAGGEETGLEEVGVVWFEEKKIIILFIFIIR